jgi:integrase
MKAIEKSTSRTVAVSRLVRVCTVFEADEDGNPIGLDVVDSDPAPCNVGTEEKMPRRRYQKGRIFQSGGKRKMWVGTFREDIIMPDGALRRVRRTVRLGLVKNMRRQDADLALKPYLDAVNIPDIPPLRRHAGLTLAKLVEEWERIIAPTLKPTTARQARSHLRTHILPSLGEVALTAINTRNVQVFVSDLTAKGLCRVTIGHVVRTLHNLLVKAKAWKYVYEVFDCKALSLPTAGEKQEQRFFPKEQSRQIIEASEEPDATVYAVLALTGLRPGEALGLEVADLDFDRKLIHVRRTLDHATRTMLKPKSKSSAADVPMAEELAKRLQLFLANHWRPNKLGLLFCNSKGRPMQRDKLAYRLQATLQELGIEKAGLHAFRHGLASELLQSGVSPQLVQKQLRHSDAHITLTRYAHIIGSAQKDAVDSLAGKVLVN